MKRAFPVRAWLLVGLALLLLLPACRGGDRRGGAGRPPGSPTPVVGGDDVLDTWSQLEGEVEQMSIPTVEPGADGLLATMEAGWQALATVTPIPSFP